MKKQIFMTKSFKIKIYLLIIFVISTGFIITSVIRYADNSCTYKTNAENITELTSEGIYYQIQSLFEVPINVSLTMANDKLLQDFLEVESDVDASAEFIETVQEYLDKYQKKYNYDSVFLVSSETGNYYNFKGLNRTMVRDNPENDWFYAFIDSGSEYSLNVDNDEASNDEITVFINCKIRNSDGKLQGIVGVGMYIDSLQALLNDYEEQFSTQLYLIDNNGKIEIGTNESGFNDINLFDMDIFSSIKNNITDNFMLPELNSFWHPENDNVYVVTRYISALDWNLVAENNMTSQNMHLTIMLIREIIIVALVAFAVIMIISFVIKFYNKTAVDTLIKKEAKYHEIFRTSLEQLYDNIYELNITKNCADNDITNEYFKRVGVTNNVYTDALKAIAQRQIKENFRQLYIDTFSPENVISNYNSGITNLRCDIKIKSDDNESFYWMRIQSYIYKLEDDNSIHMFTYRKNIDEEKRRTKNLTEKAKKDPLTNLFNKITTEEEIDNILINSSDEMYALYIFDIDNFKGVNDTCGHAFGDKVIIEVANILQRLFRQGDIIGRIGGDEFIVFLPVIDEELAIRKAQAIVSALNMDYTYENKTCHVSASVGVVMSPEFGDDFETLYKNADTALYTAKNNGKNQYAFYNTNIWNNN